jgi:hypothetical protein
MHTATNTEIPGEVNKMPLLVTQAPFRLLPATVVKSLLPLFSSNTKPERAADSFSPLLVTHTHTCDACTKQVQNALGRDCVRDLLGGVENFLHFETSVVAKFSILCFSECNFHARCCNCYKGGHTEA